MTDEGKLPDSLTLLNKVLPAGQDLDFSTCDAMTLVGILNDRNRRLREIINESGNGMRFRMERDRLFPEPPDPKSLESPY